MSIHSILVATEFSDTPAGRYLSDGPHSGQAFRDTLLFPSLQNFDLVEVDLDGTLGCGSSFLEEAFGGLLREKGMTLKEVKAKLTIKSRRKFYQDRIWKYIADEASKHEA